MRGILNGRWWMGAVAATTLLGCGAPSQIDEPGKGEKAAVDYPAGPYGYAVDNVIENFKLFGHRDLNADGSVLDDAAQDLWLSDYRAKNKVIVLTASAEWCEPCNEEQKDLVALHADYESKNAGVAFLEAVVENKNHQPSDDATIQRWATKHSIPFDLALDPAMALQKYYDINAFPFGMVIRTSDMKIMWEGNGAAPDSIKKTVDFLLSEE